MAAEIISRSISVKVWERARIELSTPGSAARHILGYDCENLPLCNKDEHVMHEDSTAHS